MKTNDEGKPMQDNKIIVSEQDLGTWFSLDDIAIKTQPQLDVTILSLATGYGLPVPECQLELIHKVVFETDHEEDLDHELVDWLIASAEIAYKYLNNLLPQGYKFGFTGEQYENFVLTTIAE
jgi:hypothetical protein